MLFSVRCFSFLTLLFFCFFFFKQKTAYEMRISDWSSDVCSSDLVGALRTAGGDRHDAVHRRSLPGAHRPHARLRNDRCGGVRRRAAQLADPRRPARPGDRRRALQRAAVRHPAGVERQSTVEGKSVSVRVALGGPRFYKKKKKDIAHTALTNNK